MKLEADGTKDRDGKLEKSVHYSIVPAGQQQREQAQQEGAGRHRALPRRALSARNSAGTLRGEGETNQGSGTGSAN